MDGEDVLGPLKNDEFFHNPLNLDDSFHLYLWV